MSNASLSPDGRTVAVQGSPECMGGIGMNVAEGQTPSMYDYQLYLLDVEKRIAACRESASRFDDVRAVTREFNPSVTSMQWSEADGMLYFPAEDKDCVHLFRLSPKSGRIERVSVPEEVMGRFIDLSPDAFAATMEQKVGAQKSADATPKP